MRSWQETAKANAINDHHNIRILGCSHIQLPISQVISLVEGKTHDSEANDKTEPGI